MSSPKQLQLIRLHLIVGWWSLLVFVAMGIFLEALHGLKLGWYLSVDAGVRRLMWTLAHSHGALLGSVHIAFAFTLTRIAAGRVLHWANWASVCLILAGVLIPMGFFLGGLFYYSTDPGLGILLVPPGGALLLIAMCLIARAVSRRATAEDV